MTHPFRLSGRIAAQDHLHQPTTAPSPGSAPDEHYLAPETIWVEITHPKPARIGVPQYAETVRGVGAAYDPAGDCEGNFMSSKFMVSNNCYAYGTNIATNTFPQPGRCSGYELTPADFDRSVDGLGQLFRSYAEKDGLLHVGTSVKEVLAFKAKREGERGALDGHFAALMVSPAGDANWPGDYHWSRCDNSQGGCDSWSQKDGSDQVTNFDFAGAPITDPARANWTVNQGPIENGDQPAMVVSYFFHCFMFVPKEGVNII